MCKILKRKITLLKIFNKSENLIKKREIIKT